jgi:hypothetical protein
LNSRREQVPPAAIIRLRSCVRTVFEPFRSVPTSSVALSQSVLTVAKVDANDVPPTVQALAVSPEPPERL